MRAIQTLQKEFQTIVGYSDHTKGIEVSIAAVAMGARIVEKHFTLDKTWPGPDHASSLNPEEFAHLVDKIRMIETALGDGVKRCMPSEESTKAAARKSIVLARDKKAGELLTKDDLEIKRPGTGIEPRYYQEVIGKVLLIDKLCDELLAWGDLE
ncbi:N,N'-diacetyllegionaminic acid synthase [compost metagenome]